MLGVKKIFGVEDVILVLKEMLKSYKGVLDDKLLEFVCNLVELFVNVYNRFVFLEEYKNICILDEYGFLMLIWMFCLDDSILL